MDIFKVLGGIWLSTHDIADKIIHSAIDEAYKKPEDSRTLVDGFLIDSELGEKEILNIFDSVGFATKKDFKKIEDKLDELIKKAREK